MINYLHRKGLKKAIEICGGTQQSLANAITEMFPIAGVSRESVQYWQRTIKLLPLERALQIEKVTGGKVTQQELRPDLFGK